MNSELVKAETFSVLDGAWIGNKCYPNAKVLASDISAGGYTHRKRQILITVGAYALSIIFGDYTYSTNGVSFDGVSGEKPFTETPTTAEIAVMHSDDNMYAQHGLLGEKLFLWEDSVLGYQTPAEVRGYIAKLEELGEVS